MSGVQCLKREGCIVMLAFLGGIVLTNLLGANRQIHGQLLNQTFLQQYAYKKWMGISCLVMWLWCACRCWFSSFCLEERLTERCFPCWQRACSQQDSDSCLLSELWNTEDVAA